MPRIASVPVRPLSRFSDLGQSEVGDLGRAVGRQQDVARLQVAVNQAQPVGLGDRAGQWLDQGRGAPRRPGSAVDRLVEAAAGHVLELEKRQAVDLADGVDLDDVGVLEPGDGLSLAPEPEECVGIGVGAGQDHLQGTGRLSRTCRAW